MAAFNHNTVLSCRQTAEGRCVCAVQSEPASGMLATALVFSGTGPMSFHSAKPCKIRWGTSDPDQLK